MIRPGRSVNVPLSRRAALCGTVAAGFGFARSARADGPRILIVGDSMIAGGFGLYLELALRKLHGFQVKRRGKSSTGLARPDFFNWQREAARLVAEFPPEVSVVMFGGNDVQGLWMAKDQWIRWHEDGWAEEYARRVASLCDVLAPDGQRVFWVGMPVMRPEKFHLRVQRINTIVRAEMAIRKNADFVDVWSVLADEKGAYTDKLEVASDSGRSRRVRVRAGDGIHLSRDGAHVLKAHVLDVMLAALAEA